MTYVVTAGGNVTEIEAKMKRILATLQLVQLVRKIWGCTSNSGEGGQAIAVQDGRGGGWGDSIQLEATLDCF